MKLIQLTALIITAFSIAACGGGSGGVSVKPDSGTSGGGTSGGGTSGGGTSGGGTSGGGTSGGGTSGGGTSGGGGSSTSQKVVGAVLKFDETANTTPFTIDKTDGLNILKVDGREIEIVRSGLSGNILTEEVGSTGIKKYVGGNMQYSRFGMISYGQEKIDYLFVQGIPTADMPTSGTASYKGAAIYGDNKTNGMKTGNAVFSVDFANKTISGTISPQTAGEFANVTLGANISGNTFRSLNSTGYNTAGGFFGPAAAEMAGTYGNSDNSAGGAFGAKRQ